MHIETSPARTELHVQFSEHNIACKTYPSLSSGFHLQVVDTLCFSLICMYLIRQATPLVLRFGPLSVAPDARPLDS
jgi:hypothetical protein